MDNIGIIVDDLDAMVAFFLELGLELEGKASVEGDWVDRLVALRGVRCDIAMLRTPDGHGRIELSSFQKPKAHPADPHAPVNTLGLRRLMFAVTDIDEVLGRLRKHGAELMGEMVQYEDHYRLCYLRGPEGIMIALAQPLRE
ncbi:MAG: VOC family protein [Candidatus Hydrogenedentes bacterium]|nr:VOC family protein [Candidatus Hydrogenedentota bacterium]